MLDLVKLKVGVDVHLGRVALDIKGVEAQALLKVRLDHVAAVVDRVMTTLDRNPELLESIGEAIEDIGAGTGDMLGESGEAVEDVGEGTETALEHIGQGAGKGVGEIGKGPARPWARSARAPARRSATCGEGAGEAVGDVGEGAGEAVGNLDELVAGSPAGPGRGGSVGELAEGAGELGVSAGDIAKIATKIAAQRAPLRRHERGEGPPGRGQPQGQGDRRAPARAQGRRGQRHAGGGGDLADELDVDLEDGGRHRRRRPHHRGRRAQSRARGGLTMPESGAHPTIRTSKSARPSARVACGFARSRKWT